jgi:DNA-binding IclR family transcriptional regulator
LTKIERRNIYFKNLLQLAIPAHVPCTIRPDEEHPMPPRSKESYSIQSVDNALNVLEALSDAGNDIRISHLSERLGMNKTSVFRMLATFESRGYVEREQETGRYRLGLSAYEIGQKLLSRMEVLRHARPAMEQLARDSGEAAYLAVRRGQEVLFLDMVDSLQKVKVAPLTGRRYPVGAVAAGRAILAFTPSQSRDRALDPTDLAAIQNNGVACDQDALGDGTASLAAAILRASKEVAGSLVLIGPHFRLANEAFQAEFAPRLREAADFVSSRLGYLGRDLERDGI